MCIADIGSAEGLVFDPVFRDLYWTSYTNSSVSKISVDVRGARPVKIVQLEPEDHPRAIVIENCNSYVHIVHYKHYVSLKHVFFSVYIYISPILAGSV